MAGSLTSLSMAMTFGGVVYAWTSGRIIALFVVTGVLTIIFFLQQIFTVRTTVETRLFPLHFLRSPVMIMLALVMAATGTGLLTIIYFVPLLYQLARGNSAVEAGVQLLPFICFMVTMCVINGAVLSRFGYYMPWFLFSGCCLAVGAGLLFTIDESSTNAKLYGYSFIYALGVGASLQMPFSVAQAKAKPEEGSPAIGYCTYFQFASPAVSLSIANAVFLNDAVRKQIY